ncbi:TPA: hypothetical protein DCE37_15290 [Candidatus Latescibacteria bacterium]|nr:hypothetical protein [Candidatus Latescibacterota bacterium]|tara:strand:- start:398 stop:1030 length:633 start_codon:yes stop_codon:yes gene_type:complete
MSFSRTSVLAALLSACGFVDSDAPPTNKTKPTSVGPPTAMQDNPQLRENVESLRRELESIAGRDIYIVIDRHRNRLTVRSPDSVVVEATCATGSGKILLGAKRRQAWHFKTPRRVFSVQKKVKNPIWKKPVWAFVEKNEEAPVLPWIFNRLDGTTLGDFALELQDSYAIHGTLYPNLLGRSITHGCVRLDADDLTTAYRHAEIGTQVYVF